MNDQDQTAGIDEVDLFIGVDGPGSTLCGPYRPLGVVRLGPDTVKPHRTHGYQSDKPIEGFTHTHVSGTGGEGRFGNVKLTPFAGTADTSPAGFSRANEGARIGEYTVDLMPDDISVLLTSTHHCGISRFVFNNEAKGANLMIDAGAVHYFHDLRHAECLDAKISWTSKTDFCGFGTFKGGWGHWQPYSIFLSGSLDRPPDEIYVEDLNGLQTGLVASGPMARTIAHWTSSKVVTARIGVSFVSIEKARAHLDEECLDKPFSQLVAQSTSAWEPWFRRLDVEGGSQNQRTIFYTFLNRLLCMPSDLGTGNEFDKWPTERRHFSEFYCLWDSVRNANSLLMLIAPELQRDMLNCLLDIAENRGWLPDAWITGHSTKVQGGSSADILFNEAKLKGLDGIDYQRALNFMRKNNEVHSGDPFSFGRHLDHYSELGYVSTETINCVSRHLEYAYQDWCIGQLADQLGDRVIAEQYYASARKVWNLWHPDLAYFAPKTPGGSWAEPFDINTTKKDSWNDPYFYEGPSRAWSYNTQHDFAGLVARCGGEKAFEARLDLFFAEKKRATKETFMHIPLLYHYANRPDKSSATLRNILLKAYSTARNGLPDNEDMGCHSAFYICGSLGLYPMMGQDWYFLTAPVFQKSTIRFGEAEEFLTIIAPAASSRNVYIRSAKLNGQPLMRAWIKHKELKNGAVIELDLSEEENPWGIGHPPPSPLQDSRR